MTFLREVDKPVTFKKSVVVWKDQGFFKILTLSPRDPNTSAPRHGRQEGTTEHQVSALGEPYHWDIQRQEQ